VYGWPVITPLGGSYQASAEPSTFVGKIRNALILPKLIWAFPGGVGTTMGKAQKRDKKTESGKRSLYMQFGFSDIACNPAMPLERGFSLQNCPWLPALFSIKSIQNFLTTGRRA
jgi:hypothetical protein